MRFDRPGAHEVGVGGHEVRPYGNGRVVRVAVIDSGIHPMHPHVGEVSGGVAITREGEDDDWSDRLGHGTAVAAAIREKAPDAAIVAVKVFDRTLSVSVHALVRAIDWAVDHECHLINMSLGTTRLEHAARLHAAAERAAAAGVVLVAARDDAGQQFLPGSLPCVVGVTVDWHMPRDVVRGWRGRTGQVVCAASGYPREIPGVPPGRNLTGVSFAVANATGHLAHAAAGNVTRLSADPYAFAADVLIDKPLVPA